MFDHFSETIKQLSIIDTVNRLVDILPTDSRLKKLNEEGACNCLSFVYALYARTNRREEFMLYLRSLNSLRNKKNMDDFIGAYKKNPNSYEKFIHFITAVNLAQADQSLKQIRANWDKSYSFICNKNELENYLTDIQINIGDAFFINIGVHTFFVERVKEGYYLFEPNIINQSAETPILKTESELSNSIVKNLSWIITNNNMLAFTTAFISYGDKNRGLDDIITGFGQAQIANYPEMNFLVNEYRKGKISRVDLAFSLLDAISEFAKNNPISIVLQKFQTNISDYAKEEITFLNKMVTRYAKHINETAFKFDISLLYLATDSNQLSLVKKLIALGANVNQANKYGFTPLYNASQKNHLDIVKLLLDNNADPNLAVKDGSTSLFQASDEGHIEVAKLLLAKNADPNHASKEGFTPLLLASSKGHVDILNLLLDNNGDPNLAAKNGDTPLHGAAEKGHIDVVKLLLTKNIDPNVAMNDGTTSLYLGAGNGHLDVVKLLLDNNANPNLRTKNGETPLHAAVAAGHFEIIKLLLENKVNPANPNLRMFTGVTPIYTAAEEGHLNIVKLLLENKADLNLKTFNNMAPLYIASANGHLDIVKLLLDNNANLNQADDKGVTPLNIAAKKGHLETVKLLLTQINNTEDMDKALTTIKNQLERSDLKTGTAANTSYQAMFDITKLRLELEKMAPQSNAGFIYKANGFFRSKNEAAAASALKRVIYGDSTIDTLKQYERDLSNGHLKDLYEQCKKLFPEKNLPVIAISSAPIIKAS